MMTVVVPSMVAGDMTEVRRARKGEVWARGWGYSRVGKLV